MSRRIRFAKIKIHEFEKEMRDAFGPDTNISGGTGNYDVINFVGTMQDATGIIDDIVDRLIELAQHKTWTDEPVAKYNYDKPEDDVFVIYETDQDGERELATITVNIIEKSNVKEKVDGLLSKMARSSDDFTGEWAVSDITSSGKVTGHITLKVTENDYKKRPQAFNSDVIKIKSKLNKWLKRETWVTEYTIFMPTIKRRVEGGEKVKYYGSDEVEIGMVLNTDRYRFAIDIMQRMIKGVEQNIRDIEQIIDKSDKTDDGRSLMRDINREFETLQSALKTPYLKKVDMADMRKLDRVIDDVEKLIKDAKLVDYAAGLIRNIGHKMIEGWEMVKEMYEEVKDIPQLVQHGMPKRQVVSNLLRLAKQLIADDEQVIRESFGGDNLKVTLTPNSNPLVMDGEGYRVEVYRLDDGAWNQIEGYSFKEIGEANTKFDEIVTEF